ncbi:hypothetical protein BP6252_10283 [Coleophoma cylindrospora]|uniref:Uncharacterized protein n=1 Tax=Coleophoma cylindrospora TaxID=1849047 RepID=A0A3D8QS68_9HELO|nr:hypothetical protein BP6252_10283 [Coleophoma cylindrospora]
MAAADAAAVAAAGIPYSTNIGLPIFELILVWTTVSLRIWVRKFLVKNFGLDDWFILSALQFSM